jgi:hypothetical protein
LFFLISFGVGLDRGGFVRPGPPDRRSGSSRRVGRGKRKRVLGASGLGWMIPGILPGMHVPRRGGGRKLRSLPRGLGVVQQHVTNGHPLFPQGPCGKRRATRVGREKRVAFGKRLRGRLTRARGPRPPRRIRSGAASGGRATIPRESSIQSTQRAVHIHRMGPEIAAPLLGPNVRVEHERRRRSIARNLELPGLLAALVVPVVLFPRVVVSSAGRGHGHGRHTHRECNNRGKKKESSSCGRP